jgi:hypothetical protein
VGSGVEAGVAAFRLRRVWRGCGGLSWFRPLVPDLSGRRVQGIDSDDLGAALFRGQFGEVAGALGGDVGHGVGPGEGEAVI